MKRRTTKKYPSNRKTISLITEQGIIAWEHLSSKYNMSELIEDYVIYKARMISTKPFQPLTDRQMEMNVKSRQFILDAKFQKENKNIEQITEEANKILKEEQRE